jgi:hypothetical protein
MAELHIGASSFSGAGWDGSFYPGRGLPIYTMGDRRRTEYRDTSLRRYTLATPLVLRIEYSATRQSGQGLLPAESDGAWLTR